MSVQQKNANKNKSLLIATTQRSQGFGITTSYLDSKALHDQNGKLDHPLVALEKLYDIKKCKGKWEDLKGKKKERKLKTHEKYIWETYLSQTQLANGDAPRKSQ